MKINYLEQVNVSSTLRYGRGVFKVHDLGIVAYDRDLTSNYQRVGNFEFQNQHESK